MNGLTETAPSLPNLLLKFSFRLNQQKTIHPAVLFVLGEYTFLLFVASVALATVYLIWKLPETKGKSIDEIQMILRRRIRWWGNIMHQYLLERTELLTGTFVFIGSPYRPNKTNYPHTMSLACFLLFFSYDIEWGIALSGKGGGGMRSTWELRFAERSWAAVDNFMSC